MYYYTKEVVMKLSIMLYYTKEVAVKLSLMLYYTNMFMQGLLEAVRIVLPNGEHKQCAKHVYANFSKNWSGIQFRQLFWEAAKCLYVEKFELIL